MHQGTTIALRNEKRIKKINRNINEIITTIIKKLVFLKKKQILQIIVESFQNFLINFDRYFFV